MSAIPAPKSRAQAQKGPCNEGREGTQGEEGGNSACKDVNNPAENEDTQTDQAHKADGLGDANEIRVFWITVYLWWLHSLKYYIFL